MAALNFVIVNGNFYDGHWRNGLKHGEGIYVFKNKGQFMEGVWINGVPKVSVIKHIDQPADTTTISTVHPMPQVRMDR